MDTIQAVFTATGDSPDVLALIEHLDGHVQQRLAIGDRNPATSEPVSTNCIIIRLPSSPDDDLIAICDTERWLEKHLAFLKTTDAKKTLEFHTFLDSNTGSRILTIPNTIIRICADCGLDVAAQAIRVLSDSEFANLHST